ncbi:MAG TPA: TraB/GumN family protein [Bacteroidia bacterium]|nr:TraB/GumN family protein [Bacteroidia bacterium]
MFKLKFKKTVTLGLLISLYVNLNAQNNAVNSLCWKVTGPGLSEPSYVFGTIHLISKKDFFLSKSTEAAFKSCKTLALEVDLNMNKETKKEVGKSAILPSGKIIDDFCSAEELTIIKTFMSDTVKISGLKIKLYSRLKPIYLQSILLKEQLKGAKSYEETFAKKAKKNKMNQVGLEEIDLQMKVLDTIPIQTQVKDMVSSIKEGKASIRSFNEMIEVYKTQNIEKLHQLTVSEDSGIAEFEDVFLNHRNESWIPVIEQLAKKQPTFIAVGAAHLGGEKGVLNLLKAKGYTIEPIF